MSDRPITLPLWLNEWPAVRAVISQIESGKKTGGNLTEAQRAILTRLATDDRMKNVWRLLTSRNRQTVGYKYPAQPALKDKNADENQDYYLGLALFTAFTAAWEGRAATKIEDVNLIREQLRAHAKALREVAQDIRGGWQMALQNGYSLVLQRNMDQDLTDADTLDRIAQERENQLSELRGQGDPLTITNNRGDPVARGVGATMAAFFLETFGDRMDGTAATLTNVALETRISERAVRSAFSKQKRPKKAPC